MSAWTDVGSADELARSGRVIARVAGREIGVVLVDGTPRGVRNRCPHHGGPLCLGSIRAREEGTPGRYEEGRRRVLRCPWHGWEFDPETGRCLDDAAMRVAVYDAKLADGRVLVRA